MNNIVEENQECTLERACSSFHGIGEQLKFLSIPLLLLFLAVLYFAWPSSIPVTEDDETRYVETSRHMISSGDYITPVFNGHVRYLKPVFIYWLQAGTMKVFNSEIPAARAESGIMMLILTLSLFFFVRYNLRKFNNKLTDVEISFASFLAATAVSLTIFASAWSHMATTDITLSVITSLCCLSLIQAEIYHKLIEDPAEEKKLALYAYLFAGLTGGLAFLTKGPVGPGVPFGMWFVYHISSSQGSIFSKVWYLSASRNISMAFKRIPWLPVMAIFIAVSAPWYILITRVDGGAFLREFFLNENVKRASDAMEGHNFGYLSLLWYFLFAFLLTFPFSAMPITAKIKSIELNEDNKALKIMRDFSKVWFFLVIIVFSIVKTQLISYIQSVMVPVALLFVIGIIANRQHNLIPRAVGYITTFIGVLLTGGGIYLLSQKDVGVDNHLSQPFIADQWSALIRPYALEALILFGAIFIAFAISLIARPKLEIMLKFLIPSWAAFLLVVVVFVMPIAVKSMYGTTQTVGMYLKRKLDADKDKNIPVIAFVNHFNEGLALYTQRTVTHIRPDDISCIDKITIQIKNYESAYIVTTPDNIKILDDNFNFIERKKDEGKLSVVRITKRNTLRELQQMMEKKDGNN